jgi:hypothetical protein
LVNEGGRMRGSIKKEEILTQEKEMNRRKERIAEQDIILDAKAESVCLKGSEVSAGPGLAAATCGKTNTKNAIVRARGNTKNKRDLIWKGSGQNSHL